MLLKPDHLVAVGVFACDASGRYATTSLGEQLRDDAPHGLKPLLDLDRAGGRAELAFVELLHTITTGEPAYARRYGRDFWADLDAEPRLRRSFDAQMNWRFREQAPQLARRFDWSRFAEIVDVGGGDGLVLAEILCEHPEPRGRVLELAPTAESAAERFRSAGLAGRAQAVTGSFFEPLPDDGDVYVLSDILHDWDDDHARTILANCARAAGPDGTVVAIEPIRGDGVGTDMDLFMLLCFGGRERTVAELAALASDAGLSLRATSDVAEGRTALEFGAAPARTVAYAW